MTNVDQSPVPLGANANGGFETSDRSAILRLLVDDGRVYAKDMLAALIFLIDPNAQGTKISQKALDAYATLTGVMASAPGELVQRLNISRELAEGLAVIYRAMQMLLREPLLERKRIPGHRELEAYARLIYLHEKVEVLHVLFLDSQNGLISDIAMHRGSIDHVSVYPRLVVKKALEFDASAVIVMHNHPSGNSSPSQADILMTKQIQNALETLDLVLHDHIIFVRDKIISLRAEGFIKRKMI